MAARPLPPPTPLHLSGSRRGGSARPAAWPARQAEPSKRHRPPYNMSSQHVRGASPQGCRALGLLQAASPLAAAAWQRTALQGAAVERQLRGAVWRVLAGTGTLPLTRRRLTAREGGVWFSLAADQASCTRRRSGLSKELYSERCTLLLRASAGRAGQALAGARWLRHLQLTVLSFLPPSVASGSQRMRQADSAARLARSLCRRTAARGSRAGALWHGRAHTSARNVTVGAGESPGRT